MVSISALLLGICGGIFYGKETIQNSIDVSNPERMRELMTNANKKLENTMLVLFVVAIGWGLLVGYNASN